MKLGLKGKIFSVVAIPFAIFLIVAGLMIRSSFIEYQNAQVVVENLVILDRLSAYVHETQRERGLTAGFLGSNGDGKDLRAQRELSDKESSALLEVLSNNFTITLINEVQDVRKRVDARNISIQEAITAYNQVIERLLTKYPEFAQTSVLEDLASRVRTMSILESAKENAGKLRASLNAILVSNRALDQRQYRTIIDLNAGVATNLRSPALYLSETSAEGLVKAINGESWSQVQIVFQSVLQKSDEGNFGHSPQEFFRTITGFIDELAELVKNESAFIVKNARDIQDGARNQLFVLASSVIGLGVAIFFIVLFVVNALIKTIDRVIDELSDNSLQVSSAAKQISSSSEELSQSTTEQASSLEEASASIEELTSMINKNAANAQKAAEFSEGSLESAEKGKRTIQEMLEAIQNIYESNNTIKEQIDESNSEISAIVNVISEIGDKTKIINDIVFQTRLLSFNASVEAARAGEHGKGFAVVAEEVGNLAQMSGNAAKEISLLLEDSLEKVTSIVEKSKSRIEDLMNEGRLKVETGIKVANSCDEALEEIVVTVQQVSQMAHEISSATREQDEGVREISVAMTQLEKLTQVNAATSEETASAAEELAAQAASLQQVVQVLVEVTKGDTQQVKHETPADSDPLELKVA
ncbi:MAG TPA: methyl-accepting chemotaxis protein [Bacteriovoracaceae bacterium]|nr:methyl-accepting chemotaxis protein [Bacteriovoracaceae bacterium]